MRRNTLYTIGVFLIAIVVTVAGFFLLDIERIALNYWAFGFLLFSLVLSLLSLITIKGSVFYNAAVIGAVWLYQIVVIATMFFVKIFSEAVNKFVLMEITINALFFIAAILIIASSRYVHDSDAKTFEKLNNGDYNTPKRGGF
jgi:hypothetical protein